MSFRTLINSLLIKSGVPAASDGSSNPICNLFPTSPVKAGQFHLPRRKRLSHNPIYHLYNPSRK